MSVAVIADIVGSRALPDRARAQQELDAAIMRAEHEQPLALEPLRPTVGDEQQGVYPSLPTALAGILRVQLALPDGLTLRFGLGVGAIGAIASADRVIPDGPAWWAAREAIDALERMQQRAAPAAAAWIVAAPEEDVHVHEKVGLANAYLAVRDQLVAGLSVRARRLISGRMSGRSQADLARREGISQSAVSQALLAAGAPALMVGLDQLAAAAELSS